MNQVRIQSRYALEQGNETIKPPIKQTKTKTKPKPNQNHALKSNNTVVCRHTV